MNIPTIQYVFDRKHNASADVKGVVELRITHQRKRKYITTGVKCFPSQWDAKKELVKASLQANEYNLLLTEMKKRTLKVIYEMTERGRIDLSAIPVLLRQESVDITFTDYFYKRMKEKQVTELTHLSYGTTYNKLLEFGKIKFFSDINQRNIRAFGEWLHAYTRDTKDAYGRIVKKKYSQATIYKITSNLSLFINDAIVDGFLTDNPYVTKRMYEDKGRTRIDQYLTADELRKVEQAEMPTNSICEARDLFLLQCYTGLSYIDLMTYDFTKNKNMQPMELCYGKRHKTGVEFRFVMTEEALVILRKYGYRMPKLPNQKYNYKLKVVADAARIDKALTSHMGRRTAGSVWLNNGIPIEVVSKCLGHSSILMTQKAYARILDNTIVEAFRKAASSANETAQR